MLKSNSLIVQLLEGLELERQHLITECRIEALAEQFLLILIIGNITRSIASQTGELVPISLDIPLTLRKL